ncbi:MAG: amidohydrolase family protein, partial [Deltaproteobacteria bacterium]|nr:amidohydrolase family protein [Deltaproteobacteria bacterium]
GAAGGGGILKTVEAVRDSSEEELLIETEKRLESFIRNGCATVEIKSGYGLDTENELKMLRVVGRLRENSGIEIVPTFLAHVIPREYGERRGEYIGIITRETLPEISRLGLAEFCDVFLDRAAFSYEEAKTILSRARDLGFKLKIHANQFENNRGGLLAVELECASAGHLNHTSEEEIKALAEKGVSAVLFPGCFVSKGDSGAPPVRKLLETGVNLAVSTDYNPGSSTTRNVALMGTLAMSLWGMTYKEVFRAITAGAARALQRSEVTGRLEAGYRADIAIFDCGGIEEVFYDYGTFFCAMLIAGSRIFKFFDQ